MKYLLVSASAASLVCAPMLYAETDSPDSEQMTIERITIHGQASRQSDLLVQSIATSLSPDVRKQLDAEPGISINSNGMITGVIQHRGLFGDRLHVSHQGASVFGAGPNAMDSPLSHVISASAPVATVYRGISPVSAGYESVGGVIEFNEAEWSLTQSAEIQFRGNLNIDLANNGDQQQYAGFGEAVSTTWGLRASGQYQTADDYKDGSGEQVNNTRYDRLLGSLSGIWREGDHEVTYSISHNHTNYAGTPSLAMDIEYIDATWYRLQYQRLLTDASFKVRVFGNNNRHDMSNFILRETAGPMQRRNNVASDVLGLAFEYDAEWQLGNNPLNFKSGVEWHTREHQSVINNPANNMFFINNFNEVQRDILTAFSEFNWRDQHGHFVSFGLRPTQVKMDASDVGSNMVMMNPNVAELVDTFNQSDRSLSRQWLDGALQIGKQFNQNWTAHASVAQKGRAPNYHEVYTWFPLGITAGLADGRNYIGDLMLEEEIATQLELGVDYQKGGLKIQPRIFRYDIDDYINGRPTDNIPANRIAMMMGAMPPLQWSNIDAELWGGDIALLYQVSANVQFDASIEWLRGVDTELNQPLYRLAPRRADLTLRYDSEHWKGFVTAALVDSQERVSTFQNEPATAGYATVDTGVSYAFSSGVKLSLSINNLLDKDYVNHVGGINRVRGANTAVGSRVPEIGRSVGLSMNYHF